jgi:hypothetical protein
LNPCGQGFRKVIRFSQRGSARLFNHWRPETRFSDHDRITVCFGLFELPRGFSFQLSWEVDFSVVTKSSVRQISDSIGEHFNFHHPLENPLWILFRYIRWPTLGGAQPDSPNRIHYDAFIKFVSSYKVSIHAKVSLQSLYPLEKNLSECLIRDGPQNHLNADKKPG